MPHTILLVDDEYGSLEVLTILFEREGFEILTATDGEEALARLQEKRPDLVITDYWMPKMDGVTLCNRIHEDERWRGIPIIVLSATYAASIPTPPGVLFTLLKRITFPVLLADLAQLPPLKALFSGAGDS